MLRRIIAPASPYRLGDLQYAAVLACCHLATTISASLWYATDPPSVVVIAILSWVSLRLLDAVVAAFGAQGRNEPETLSARLAVRIALRAARLASPPSRSVYAEEWRAEQNYPGTSRWWRLRSAVGYPRAAIVDRLSYHWQRRPRCSVRPMLTAARAVGARCLDRLASPAWLAPVIASTPATIVISFVLWWSGPVGLLRKWDVVWPLLALPERAAAWSRRRRKRGAVR